MLRSILNHSSDQHTYNLEGKHTAMNDSRARLVIFLLRDPHVLEGTERTEDTASNPNRVLALGRGRDLDLNAARSEREEFLVHAIRDTGEHGGTTGKDDVGVQFTTDVKISLEDGIVSGGVNSRIFFTKESRVEQGFWSTEPGSRRTVSDTRMVRKRKVGS